jgi:transposase
MFLSLPRNIRIFIACDAVDMRKSFDGLSLMVQHRFHREPFSGDLFVFFNRSRDRVKMLLWDGNGFWVFAKRLESGAFARWPEAIGEAPCVPIDRARLGMLLEGVEMNSVKLRPRFAHSVPIDGSDGEANRHRQAQ